MRNDIHLQRRFSKKKCTSLLISIIMVIVALSGSFYPRAGYAEGEEIVLSMSGYHQTTSYTCGSASSLMVLYYCGAKEALLKDGITNDKKFHEKFRKHTEGTKGIWLDELTNGLNYYLGTNTYAIDYMVSSADSLVEYVTNSLKNRRPVVASCYWYGGHYVVIFGVYYKNGKAYFKIKDPAKSASATIEKSASEFYDSMPYPKGDGHPIAYGIEELKIDPYINIDGAAYPAGQIKPNQAFELKGTASSNEVISSVSASVYYLSDNTLVPASLFSTKTNPVTISPNSKSVDIYPTKINTGLKFGELKEEAYRYELNAITASGYSKTLVDSVFTVGSFVLSTEVKMEQSSMTIIIGQQEVLKPTIIPDTATKKTLLWTSDNPAVAEVNSDGVVTGKSAGVAVIVAETVDGSSASDNCLVTVNEPDGIAINEANFPDPNFQTYVKKYDLDANGFLSEEEIGKVQSMIMVSKEIKQLKGIEYFTALTGLDCTDNELTSLDMSGNPNLIELTCDMNEIESLIIGNNTRLTDLSCASNKLTALDVSKNTELVGLYCDDNQLTKLDIQNNAKLRRLVTRYNKITQLDLRNCPELIKLVGDTAPEEREDSTYAWANEEIEESHLNSVLLYKYTLIIDKTTELLNASTDKVEAFVKRCYKLILNRDADEGGLKSWSEALKSKTAAAGNIINGFVGSSEFINRNLGSDAAVEILYKTMLDRPADEGGKAGWVDALSKGSTLQNIIDGFCRSDEFKGLCKEYGIEPGSGGAAASADMSTPRGKIEAFVRRCYKLILNRDADEGGLKGWSDALESGAGKACQIIDGFVRSPEYVGRKLSNAESVDILYQTMLNRTADEGGKVGWVEAMNQGYTLQHIINGFCGSAEFTAICNDYGISAGTLTVASALVRREAITPEGDEAEAPVVYQGYNSEFINEEKIRAFVEHCYAAVFGREGDAEGIENYTALILNGKKTPKSVAREFVFSAEFQGKLPGNEEFIRILYRLYFDREPGADELSGWVKMLEDGASLEEIVDGFAASAEFKAIVNEMKN